MRCSKCGSDNPEQRTYCDDCASLLGQQQLVITPQLQQAMEVLKLSLPELTAVVKKNLAPGGGKKDG